MTDNSLNRPDPGQDEQISWDALSEFRAAADQARKAFTHVCGDLKNHVPSVSKHMARNHEHLRQIHAEAKVSNPRFADTLAWLLWHDIKDADRLVFLMKHAGPARAHGAKDGSGAPEFQLLVRGDKIFTGDEFLADDCTSWLTIVETDLMFGRLYDPGFHVPMRRAINGNRDAKISLDDDCED